MRMDRTHKLGRNAEDQATRRPQKQAVNLSISRELLNRARSGDLNLSNILEVALEQKLKQQARELWLAENRAGIEAYNEQVEKLGVFSDGLRAF
jgi:post-segregation antitoxin (ccd killing protein)